MTWRKPAPVISHPSATDWRTEGWSGGGGDASLLVLAHVQRKSCVQGERERERERKPLNSSSLLAEQSACVCVTDCVISSDLDSVRAASWLHSETESPAPSTLVHFSLKPITFKSCDLSYSGSRWSWDEGSWDEIWNRKRLYMFSSFPLLCVRQTFDQPNVTFWKKDDILIYPLLNLSLFLISPQSCHPVYCSLPFFLSLLFRVNCGRKQVWGCLFCAKVENRSLFLLLFSHAACSSNKDLCKINLTLVCTLV